jgi:mono/diheme cytochrome c family protein
MPRAIALLGSLLFVLAGARAGETLSPEQIEFFEKNIRPVLAESCQSCHGPEKHKGGLRLDSRAALMKGGTGGAVIDQDKVDKSVLMQAIRHEGDITMPPKKKLSEKQIADFATWIRTGAAWPGETGAKDADAWKKHWAFQPVREAAPPAMKNAKWAQSPIDAFVLAQLDVNKLTPSPQADKRTLIRRASFDLTGLPPSDADVRAFEADTSPDAFKKIVDRLLDSPQYGERWGRYWLDVARYADTKGYVYDGRETREFVHAQHYRNWVINAFNVDMPYDQFLLQQIAADSLPEKSREALPAMGFLTLGRRFLGNIHDIIDDRIDVLMRGTQGLSVGCARCHDHKFDPIPTKDYYAFYGVFHNSLEKMEPFREPVKNDAFAAYEKGLAERRAKLYDTFEKKKRDAAIRYRARVDEYLVALLDVAKLPSEEFYEIMNANDINPFVVRMWQSYVFKARGTNHPVFAPWLAFADLSEKTFAEDAAALTKKVTSEIPAGAHLNKRIATAFETPPQSMKEVAQRYGAALKAVNDEWLAAVKKAKDANQPEPVKLDDADAEELRLVLYGPGSAVEAPTGTPTSIEFYFTEENVRVELGKLQVEIDKWIIKSDGAPAHAVYLEDRPEPKTVRVFLRGNPRTRGDEVTPHFLKFLGEKKLEHGSGRLELAQAIVDKSNPLTARLMVNRIWNWHFGAGLVSTPSDFGMRTPPPSHPELLDFLATRFMERWSVKDLHRLIMLSSTYQQSSVAREDCAQIDPGNKWLWRMNRQRLDFESLHDSLLAVSGKLDLKMQGKPADLMREPFPTRRAVYGNIDRTNLPGVMRVFDFPNPDMHSPQRFNTTIPQQALFFMNNAFVIQQAQAIAARADVTSLIDPAERIQKLHAILFQRPASEHHVALARSFIEQASAEKPPEKVAAKPGSPWQYGYGEFDEKDARVKTFAALPFYAGDAWQGGTAWPDKELGWVKLTADGGHCGNDHKHDAIRRWVAPADGRIMIEGKIAHAFPQGDGVFARIVSSNNGVVASWSVHNSSAMTNIEGLDVKAGDTVDFVVDLKGTIDYDEFTWAPVIRSMNNEWHTEKDFAAAPKAPADKLNPWERYVQVLLLSNEFMFVD